MYSDLPIAGTIEQVMLERIHSMLGAAQREPGARPGARHTDRRDIQPANSWRVELDGEGGLRWVNDKEVVTMQPARSWWQRVEDVIYESDSQGILLIELWLRWRKSRQPRRLLACRHWYSLRSFR